MKIKMSSLWSAEAQIDFLRFDWHFLSTDFGVLVRDMKMFWPVAKVAIRIECGINLKMTLIPMFQIENATKLGVLVFFPISYLGQIVHQRAMQTKPASQLSNGGSVIAWIAHGLYDQYWEI